MSLPKILRSVFLVLTFALIIGSCKLRSTIHKGGYISIDSTISPDTSVTHWISKHTESLQSEMGIILGKSDTYFQPAQKRGRITEIGQQEANLARLCADWTLKGANKWAIKNGQTPVQLAILNHFGLRKSIGPGKIYTGNMYEVMPFDNEVVLLVLSGKSMIKLFNYIATLGGTPIAGAELWISDSTYLKAQIQNNAFDSRKSYCIATNDFMLGGGDGFTMLAEAKRITKTGLLLRDVFIDELSNESKKNNGLLPRTDLRIHQP